MLLQLDSCVTFPRFDNDYFVFNVIEVVDSKVLL